MRICNMDETESYEQFREEIRKSLNGGNTFLFWKMASQFDLNAERKCSFLLASILLKFKNRNTRPAKALLLLGARPTGEDLGITASYVAMDEVHRKFLHLLLRAGADVNEPYKEEMSGREITPFRQSLGYKDPYIMNLFMRYGGRISSHDDIREMVMKGNTELLDQVVKDGWDPLVRHNGLTHLEALCYNMSYYSRDTPSAVLWLIDHGASLTQRTPEGGSILSYLLYQYAEKHVDSEVVTWFLGNGARETVEWEDRYGDSPLSIAVASNAEDVILLLLSLGVSPDSGNAMKKATGEVEYHPDSLRLIRPDGPVSKRTISILRGENVDGPEEIY
jgi:ankyrin repeat protein